LPLLHHNVFFSRDYRREFDELIAQRRAPEDPTVYLCAEDRAGDGDPSDEERCFFLTNAPPLDGRGARVDWAGESSRCRERVVRTLARHGWTLETSAEQSIDPREHAERFPRSRGALYGLASNSRMAAFKRPPNQLPDVAGLFLAGGTVHPGAGLPMVCLSARIATRLALEELHGA
jgi:1-hydroxycarotenoid 3,4-desaturase